MIDIHNHILPVLDDGAAHMEESLDMAKQAVSQGIHTVFATPHHANGRYLNESPIIENSVQELNGRLQEANIPLQILNGQEIRVYHELLDDLAEGKAMTLHHSRYILLELPSHGIPTNLHEVLHELKVLNMIPIIAHPERNREIAEDPAKLRKLVELGALSQVTAHSVLGVFGKSVQRLSLELCKQNLTHFLASDAHNVTNRSFKLGHAYDVLREHLGTEMVSYFQRNANSVVENISIFTERPEWPKRKWFHFWKSS
jgi:protein-tyrosine phosphatase